MNAYGKGYGFEKSVIHPKPDKRGRWFHCWSHSNQADGNQVLKRLTSHSDILNTLISSNCVCENTTPTRSKSRLRFARRYRCLCQFAVDAYDDYANTEKYKKPEDIVTRIKLSQFHKTTTVCIHIFAHWPLRRGMEWDHQLLRNRFADPRIDFRGDKVIVE